VKPQLTKLADQPPEGPDWLHEIKFDGYRMHARLDGGNKENSGSTPCDAPA
jgi:bifunctional non-homologous end joining protein LigD